MTTREVLVKARDLISEPKRWTQGTEARDEFGKSVRPRGPKAVCWCARGAITAAGDNSKDRRRADMALIKVTETNIPWFNDKMSTTHQDVLDAFDKAIGRCE